MRFAAFFKIYQILKLKILKFDIFFANFATFAIFLLKFHENVDSIVLGQAAGVEHVSFYSRTVHLISSYNEP